MEVTTDYPCVVEYKIRVLGYVDPKWYTDVKEVVGIYGKQPLFRLAWNLTNYIHG